MCGIAGTVNWPPETAAKQVGFMLNRLAHRGPDGRKQVELGRAMLGHVRLAVIDVEHGVQPILNENQQIAVVCNGEIYNYAALRAGLIARGHQFKTASDSEVVLHLYEEDPQNFMQKLHGMFAAAVYDSACQRLVLVRDRAGQKPLFYHLDENTGRLEFASELSAWQADKFPLNSNAVRQFFALQYIDAPQTVYQDVFAVPPGTAAVFDTAKNQVKIQRYWQMDYAAKSTLSLAEYAKELHDRVETAVEKRLMAEVPLGGFLSGGVDSAIIAAVMLKKSDRPIKFYSIGFAQAAYDESDNIRSTAAFLAERFPGKVELKLQKIDDFPFELLAKTAGFYGQPFADASMMPCYLLSQFARRELTVTLSGDGADELFGGYERYVAMQLAQCGQGAVKALKWVRNIPCPGGERSKIGRLKRWLAMAGRPENERYFYVAAHGLPNACTALFGERLRSAGGFSAAEFIGMQSGFSAADAVERCGEFDFNHYLPGDVLTKVDIASMRSAQEVRSPFLDTDVMAWATQMPWRMKQDWQRRKIVLAEAFKQELPQAVLQRKKRGFGVPVAELLRKNWQAEVTGLWAESLAVEQGWLDKAELDRIWRKHLSGLADYSYLLLSAVVFELFLRRRNCQINDMELY